MGIRISKDHLHPSVIESITSLIGDLNQLETTAKGNAVEAINELLANGGNKEELENVRQQLIGILRDKGVEVTEEDDMASLISKVDEEFDNKQQQLMNALISKGKEIDGNESYDELLDLVTTPDLELKSGTGSYMYKIASSGFWTFAESTNTTYSTTINIDTTKFKLTSATITYSRSFQGTTSTTFNISLKIDLVRDGVVVDNIYTLTNNTTMVKNHTKELLDIRNGDEIKVTITGSGTSIYNVHQIDLSVDSQIII